MSGCIFCTQSFCEGFAGRRLPAFWPSKTLDPSSTWESTLVVQAVLLNPSVLGPTACALQFARVGGKDLVRAPHSASKLVLRGTMCMCFSGKGGRLAVLLHPPLVVVAALRNPASIWDVT